MASMNTTFTIREHLRPCMVNNKPALWHRWTTRSEIIPPSALRGGHSGGNITACYALIEYKDGQVEEVYPGCVRFLDTEDELREGLEYYFEKQEVEE